MNFNWHRGSKEVLPERALAAEARLAAIKKAGKKFKNSVEESLKTAPSKNRSEDASVRKRRTAEYVLGDNVAAAAHHLTEADSRVAMNLPQPVSSPLHTVLERFANLEKTIGHMVAVNEGELQAFVGSDTPLSRLLSEDVPAAAAAKKDLEQLSRKHAQCQASLDKEQRRLDKMLADEEADPDAVAQQREKKERTAHELEVLAKDVQLDQDKLASNLMVLTSRENRYAQSVYEIMRIKRQFYENAFKTIDAELPNIQRLLEETTVRPVFGEDLEDHLRATGRRIAYPVALSVAYLMDSNLEDEGLFRISAKQIKIDKFKAALDSRTCLAELLLDGDPHLHASLLKSYLRELPRPLLGGGATYDRWVRASRDPSLEDRLEAYREILRTEHGEAARTNIQYVLKFLTELSRKSEETKMTPRNISIVLGPTLLWAARGNGGGSTELEHSNLESVIGVVAALIEHYADIFPEDIDLELTEEEDPELADVRLETLRLTESSQVYDGTSLPTLAGAASSEGLRPSPSPSSSTLSVPSSSGIKGLESPSPNQKRKPSIRGMGGKLMNNPVGRNIMSKIGHGHHAVSAPATPSVAASAAAVVNCHYAPSSAAPGVPPPPALARRSLQEEEPVAASRRRTAQHQHSHSQQHDFCEVAAEDEGGEGSGCEDEDEAAGLETKRL